MTTRDTTQETKSAAVNSSKISWDTWAVLAAFLGALLIRIGVVKHVPW